MTAGGRIVRDLETREDVQGAPVKLTIDGPLQDYAARRIGLESTALLGGLDQPVGIGDQIINNQQRRGFITNP